MASIADCLERLLLDAESLPDRLLVVRLLPGADRWGRPLAAGQWLEGDRRAMAIFNRLGALALAARDQLPPDIFLGSLPQTAAAAVVGHLEPPPVGLLANGAQFLADRPGPVLAAGVRWLMAHHEPANQASPKCEKRPAASGPKTAISKRERILLTLHGRPELCGASLREVAQAVADYFGGSCSHVTVRGNFGAELAIIQKAKQRNPRQSWQSLAEANLPPAPTGVDLGRGLDSAGEGSARKWQTSGKSEWRGMAREDREHEMQAADYLNDSG